MHETTPRSTMISKSLKMKVDFLCAVVGLSPFSFCRIPDPIDLQEQTYKGVLQIMGKWQDTERADADAVFGSLDTE